MAEIGNRGVDVSAGEPVILRASATTAATAGTNGTAVYLGGERVLSMFLLNITAAATDAGDTLDVYIDWSLDNSIYYNGGHFTQAIGTGGAKKFYMIFCPNGSGTTDIDLSADAAVSTVRPTVYGIWVRARWVMVDADADGNFTWSLTGMAL